MADRQAGRHFREEVVDLDDTDRRSLLLHPACRSDAGDKSDGPHRLDVAEATREPPLGVAYEGATFLAT